MYQQHIQSPTQTDCDKSITNTVRRHSTRTSKTKHSHAHHHGNFLFRTPDTQKNFPASITLDYQQPIKRPKKYTFTSFLNITSKTDEQLLTDFVDQFAAVKGLPTYLRKKYRTTISNVY